MTDTKKLPPDSTSAEQASLKAALQAHINEPCRICGRTDLPLHVNRNCAECEIDKRKVAQRFSETMGCNCDLDNWEPERDTGHSHVCRIHKATMDVYHGRRDAP